jgi:hypothetical protein
LAAASADGRRGARRAGGGGQLTEAQAEAALRHRNAREPLSCPAVAADDRFTWRIMARTLVTVAVGVCSAAARRAAGRRLAVYLVSERKLGLPGCRVLNELRNGGGFIRSLGSGEGIPSRTDHPRNQPQSWSGISFLGLQFRAADSWRALAGSGGRGFRMLGEVW